MGHIKIIHSDNIIVSGQETVYFKVGELDYDAMFLITASLYGNPLQAYEEYKCKVENLVVIFEDIVHIVISYFGGKEIVKIVSCLIEDIEGDSATIELKDYEMGVDREIILQLYNNLVDLAGSVGRSGGYPQLFFDSWKDDMKSGYYAVEDCRKCINSANIYRFPEGCTYCLERGKELISSKCQTCSTCPSCKREDIMRIYDDFWADIFERKHVRETRETRQRMICTMFLAQKHCPPELALPKDIQGVIAGFLIEKI